MNKLNKNYNKTLDEYKNYTEIYLNRSIKNEERDIIYREKCNKINIDKNYIKLWEQYKFLESLPQPEQKSIEWFEMRNNFITASAGAQAIGESHYDKPIELLKQKIGLGTPFEENKNVHHGKKFEKIAILIYENIYNNKVGEFGLVPHISKPQISFLGASPDGICTCLTLDGCFSNLVGRMLEIKCVTSRKINTSGLEDGEMCPHYYWVQVQLQLECCDLEECDFWQCKLKDYDDIEEWMDVIEDVKTQHTEQQNQIIEIDKKYKYGTLIELLPINTDEIKKTHKKEWYGKYIYPTTLKCSIKDKIKWGEYMKENWQTIYPEYSKEYKFGKILYWHLEQSHNVLIKRDREWFKENLPKFQKFWDQVEKYKNDPKLFEEFKKELKEKEKPIIQKEKIIKIKNYNEFFNSDSD